MAKIWLIGMMGSGKTTVAPLVASRLGWRALDTDAEVSATDGRSIPEWFAVDRAAFRAAERAVVAVAAASPDDLVIACGGGVVLDPELVEIVRGSGLVVLLEAPVTVLAARVGADGGRPLLGDDVAGDLESILDERNDLYRRAAHAVVAAGNGAEAVAAEVVAAWQNWS